ncbi:MAPEG family protein [Brevundimonas sp. NIBR10]|uniref:MAPEG family protein n=1 Tax=Brevundimonas sp. NIBR10 TaxID=3015997 RepID=UPI0022F18751|nr:MAPEG family protein [Brevundimonas sp. NIBR10]
MAWIDSLPGRSSNLILSKGGVMNPELLILALAAVLLMVHIFAAAHLKTKQYGVDWNMGARDDVLVPLNPGAGRLVRAQSNYLETLPIAVIALLGVVVSGRGDLWTAIGGWIWLGARLVYLPVYAAGIPKVRTLIFLTSLVGLGMAIWPLFRL